METLDGVCRIIESAHFLDEPQRQAMLLTSANNGFSRMNWSPECVVLDFEVNGEFDEDFYVFVKDHLQPDNTSMKVVLRNCNFAQEVYHIFDSRTFLGKTSLHFVIKNGGAHELHLLHTMNSCIKKVMKNQENSKLDELVIDCHKRNDIRKFCNRVFAPPCRKFTWIGHFLPMKLINVL